MPVSLANLNRAHKRIYFEFYVIKKSHLDNDFFKLKTRIPQGLGLKPNGCLGIRYSLLFSCLLHPWTAGHFFHLLP